VIAALLLAAGASRRFGGAPKLLQELDAKPVLRWSAEALVGTQIGEIVIVVPPEHDEIRRALAGIDARFVVNPRPELGIGRSIARGTSAISPDAEAVVIILGDEPRPPRDALTRVIARYRAGGTRIVAPTYGGVRGHPVLFDRAVFDELRALSGDDGARAVVDRDPSRVALLELGEPLPIDVDTPEDLARLRSAQTHTSLIDSLMPEYDVRASYETLVRAPTDVVYRAVLETDLSRSFISRALMMLRSLGRRGQGSRSFRLRDLPARGAFFALAENAPHEVVAGVLGRFWSLTGNTIEGDSASFQRPPAEGTAKAVWNFRVDATAGGTQLSTETRVLCADATSRRQFKRYWTVIGPFSGLIRLEALRLIRAQAQYIHSTSQRS
jgi:molybdenum cofactor cytidylyltransferase